MSRRIWLCAAATLIALSVLGVKLATAPGVHWYNNWTSFAFFLDNSNWPTYFLAAALPGVFIYAWTHWLHRQQRAENRALHQAIHDKLDAHGAALAKIRVHNLKHEAGLKELNETVSKDGPVQP